MTSTPRSSWLLLVCAVAFLSCRESQSYVVVPLTRHSRRHGARQWWRQLALADQPADNTINGINGNSDSNTAKYRELEEILLKQGYMPETKEHMTITKVFKARLESLRDRFESSNTVNNRLGLYRPVKPSLSHLYDNETDAEEEGAVAENDSDDNSYVHFDYQHFFTDNDVTLVDAVRTEQMLSVSRAFVRAGPRAVLHFDPSSVNAAIVTCGGLCPGLNNVIRALTQTLYNVYGAQKVWGIRGGFHGFHELPDSKPILLTNEIVEDIHHEGGTILRSSRGGFDVQKIMKFLADKNIQQLYVIGGDGTHRAAYKIHQECIARSLDIAVVGVPKTIDNDLDYIDRSFGFLSAVEAAQTSIRTAKTEAMCVIPNGIAVVKLMGRSAGFLAAFASLGSGDVDAVLIPEVPIVLEGKDGILPFLDKRVREKKYAVVVVAEGAGEEILGTSTEVDAGGNKKLQPIGEFIRDRIKEYFEKQGKECTVRYIDPSYTVRSVPANAIDAVYCTEFAQNAVHGAMAGYTGFSVGLVNNHGVYVPIPQLVASSPRSMDPNGLVWQRILALTGQPNPSQADNCINNQSLECLLPKVETAVH